MKLSRINSLLIICIIAVNGYVILMPFLPALLYAQAAHSGKTQLLTQKIHKVSTAVPAEATADTPNELIIPAMVLDQPILEGNDTYEVLNKGILHWPASSTPDKGGNTVLIGHRFTYTNPRGVFYFLNKLQPGDEIGIVWQHKTYTYRVSSSRVVPPTEVSILAATSDARLTIFTCTPLWSPKERLVITAELTHTLQPQAITETQP